MERMETELNQTVQEVGSVEQIPTQREGEKSWQEQLRRRGKRLEWATTGANVLEAVAGIGAGLAAASIALTAFGLGAIVEIAASLLVLWSLRHHHKPERRAVKLISGAFALIGVGTILQGTYGLFDGHRAEQTLIGIVALVGSVSAMVTLGMLKVRTGRLLGSRALEANGKVTVIDGLVGAGVLLGLVLTLLFGWWWVDSVCAILFGMLALKGGIDSWREADE